MKIRLWLVCISVLFCLLLPLRAQEEIVLGEVYETAVFSLRYPADWESDSEMTSETGCC